MYLTGAGREYELQGVFEIDCNSQHADDTGKTLVGRKWCRGERLRIVVLLVRYKRIVISASATDTVLSAAAQRLIYSPLNSHVLYLRLRFAACARKTTYK